MDLWTPEQMDSLDGITFDFIFREPIHFGERGKRSHLYLRSNANHIVMVKRLVEQRLIDPNPELLKALYHDDIMEASYQMACLGYSFMYARYQPTPVLFFHATNEQTDYQKLRLLYWYEFAKLRKYQMGIQKLNVEDETWDVYLSEEKKESFLNQEVTIERKRALELLTTITD